MDYRSLKKKIIGGIIAGILIFVGLSVYSDLDKLFKVFVSFDYKYLPLILILAPLNYCFRYIKWDYYLKKVNLQVNKKDNILIFASALAATISPGKVGELLKSYLLKENNNIPVSQTAPLIMTERLTDGISMLILASVGVLTYDYGKEITCFIIAGVFMFICLVQSPGIVTALIKKMKYFTLTNKYISSIEAFYKNTYILLRLKPLLLAIVIGIISWFFEGMVIFITLKAMNYEISLLASIFIVSFSSIIGALSMLPGGLFAAEGSIFGLLLFMGVSSDMATATTIITRFSTLWLGVFIGIIALFLVQKRIFASPK